MAETRAQPGFAAAIESLKPALGVGLRPCQTLSRTITALSNNQGIHVQSEFVNIIESLKPA